MTMLSYFCAGYLIYLLLVALHELGHLLAFCYLKIGWYEFQVGPFALEGRGQETHLSYSPRWLTGRVKTMLQSGRTLTLKESIVHLSAGCIVNLVIGSVLLYIFCHIPLQRRDAYWPLFIAACVSIFLALCNLYPPSKWSSDGYRMLQLWRSHRRNSRN